MVFKLSPFACLRIQGSCSVWRSNTVFGLLAGAGHLQCVVCSLSLVACLKVLDARGVWCLLLLETGALRPVMHDGCFASPVVLWTVGLLILWAESYVVCVCEGLRYRVLDDLGLGWD